jgi:lysozyme
MSVSSPPPGALLDLCIDVSHNNEVVDWGAIAGAGIQVAMIKATQGQGYTDPQWASNRDAALAAGIRVIPYHFTNTDDPAAQAANFVQHCTPGQAYALDWEGAAADTLSPADMESLGSILQAQLGRPPLGYWGIPGSTPALPTAAMNQWPRWVPRYRFPPPTASFPADSTKTAGVPCLFWQYTSTGTVPGVNGPVDRSVAAFKSAEELLDWCDAPPGG